MSVPERVSLAAKLSEITEHWRPRVVGELNGQAVKLVKLQGEFVWHHHEAEDELFMVVTGHLRIEFRDGVQELNPGEFLIVPRGVEHRPVAEAETTVLLFEPLSVLNTGNVTHPTLTAPLDARS
ncbi:MAG TPA: cupin domain-containing protein [Vicinamibacterales bacterium]